MESRSWDTNTWVGSPEAINRDVHWTAGDLETGLSKTIEWFQQRPDLIDKYHL
jgi:hypothetical protein